MCAQNIQPLKHTNIHMQQHKYTPHTYKCVQISLRSHIFRSTDKHIIPYLCTNHPRTHTRKKKHKNTHRLIHTTHHTIHHTTHKHTHPRIHTPHQIHLQKMERTWLIPRPSKSWEFWEKDFSEKFTRDWYVMRIIQQSVNKRGHIKYFLTWWQHYLSEYIYTYVFVFGGIL